ncbi:hypothetical protein ACOI8A_05545 [Pseudomonas sp. P4795]|uniref:hypothetical protein n=1 Tax=Pseudomonas sp. P4795 TaxID=3409915 RepID=UPI003B5C9325
MSDSFQSKNIVKARSPHSCECCRRTINPCEHYINIAGKWDGDFYAVKTRMGCDSLMDLIWQFDADHGGWLSDDGLPFHEVIEIGEEFGLICRMPDRSAHIAARSA